MTTVASTEEVVRAQARSWREADPDPVTRAEVDALLAADDLAGLHERFDQRLRFGTAGLRGALGVGPNRMNRVLVRQATAAVAHWLRHGGFTGPVVVGRDARHGSAEFARDTAAVLAGAGFAVLVLPRPMPTPVLAFAVRHLEASAGIMLTASHNPATDNGYKLYRADGGQILPPADGAIEALMDALPLAAGQVMSRDGITEVGEELLDAYVAGAVALLRGEARAVTTVYTALHGVGAETMRRVWAAAGFPAAREVTQQVEPDPNFPTVAFPNPEEPGALDLAVALALEVGPDLILATDPDADRLAVAVPDPQAPQGWRALTGDDVGILLADHLLRRGDVRPGDVVATTVVSSRMLAALAAAAGVTYREALTGFKWVVHTPREGERFVFGYEEALGYCVDSLVRDKDGVTAALVVSELAAELKASGQSLLDRLDEVFSTHGVHVTGQRSIRVEGTDGSRRVQAVMAALRAAPPTALAGRTRVTMEDLAAVPLRFPVRSDVLVWMFDGVRAVVRPSGTEPKLKCYAEAIVAVDTASGVAAARDEAGFAVREMLDAIVALLRARGL
ncbi:MAG: phospho-sugar mutase [Acidimicrobiia bacterium]|nr:phospho-sugar mutase [Acidimicrobiia bacterium]